MIENLDQFKKLAAEWLFDPMKYCKEVVGMYQLQEDGSYNYALDPEQLKAFLGFTKLCQVKEKKAYKLDLTEIENELANKIGVSIQSSKGVGKTSLAALCTLWFFCCYVDARIVILGPRYEQIKKNLWPEITKWIGLSEEVYGKNSILGNIIEIRSDLMYMKHQTKAKLGKKWVIFIMTFPKNTSIEQQQAAIQGQHDDNMLFVLDESAGIPDHIFEPIESTLTSQAGPNVVFNIFNPNKSVGWAIETHGKMKSKWLTYHIDHFKSTLSPASVEEYMRLRYGVDSNKYRVSILGLPPLQEEGSLIPWDWIQRARERYDEILCDDNDPLLIGLDVGGGGDKSVLCRRFGMKVLPFEQNSDADTNIVFNWVIRNLNKDEPDSVNVDMNGIGNKIYYDLRALKRWKVNGINAKQRAYDNKLFEMIRDELGWRVREAFEKGEIAIDPNDEELEGELSLLKYDDEGTFGRTKIVSKRNTQYKQSMSSLLGYSSPNKFDSLALTFYEDYTNLRYRKKNKNSIRSRHNSRGRKLERAWMAR